MSTSTAHRPRRLTCSRQTGEGRFQAILWLLIIVWVFMAGFEYLPLRYRVAEFDDAITEQAERGGQTRGDAARIKSHLLWQANQLDLPVTKDNLSVESNASFVRINCSYTVPVEMPFWTYNWEVKHELRRKVFRF